jgi:hypothetical protein
MNYKEYNIWNIYWLGDVCNNLHAISLIEYAIKHSPKILNYLNWNSLSKNPNAYELLKEFTNNLTEKLDELYWKSLCENQIASLIFQNINVFDRIDWKIVSANPHAMNIIEQNPHPNAIKLISQNKHRFDLQSIIYIYSGNNTHTMYHNPQKTDWKLLSQNHAITEINLSLYNPLKSAYSKLIYNL